MKPQTRRNKRAFTLVEVMLAIFVITVAIFPTLLLCLSSYRTSQQAQAQTAAYLMAQKQMETVSLPAVDEQADIRNGRVYHSRREQRPSTAHRYGKYQRWISRAILCDHRFRNHSADYRARLVA